MPISVFIVDALMGSGKTSAAIHMIKAGDPKQRYLYITPFLSEVERVTSVCEKQGFMQPSSIGTKTRGIKYLFQMGTNIASTHALFRQFDAEIIEMAHEKQYTLIMDEAASVIEQLDISEHDLSYILREHATVNPHNRLLEWRTKEYDGRFADIRRMCDMGAIGIYGDATPLWLFPVSTFKAFKDTYLLTYLFNAQHQKYYYDFHGIHYRPLYVCGDDPASYHFTDRPATQRSPPFAPLLRLYSGRLNDIGEPPTALSLNWYIRHRDKLPTLHNNTYNFFRNILNSKSYFNLWTTFLDYKAPLSGKGYANGFAALNIRATNELRHKTAVAYLANRYFNPVIRNFFVGQGIQVDEDAYALSEMLQFIWRSAIRDNRPVDLYIPSGRMRRLFSTWLKHQV